MGKKAVILTSGGLDSATCLAIARSQGFECYTLAFDYGQKHCSELQAAARISKQLGAMEHKVFQLSIGQFGGSALTDATMMVPDFKPTSNIPSTYVPARNTIFLSIALGIAEILDANDIFVGVSSIDYSHYPDCRPEYIDQFQKLANLATKTGVENQGCKIHAPLILLSKAQTIQWGLKLGVDYSQTISCYRADEEGRACGRCDSCAFRKKGFQEANVVDPTIYSDFNKAIYAGEGVIRTQS